MHIKMHKIPYLNASVVRFDVKDSIVIFRMIIGIIVLGFMYKMYIIGFLGHFTT